MNLRLRHWLLAALSAALFLPLNACSQGPDESRATQRAIAQSQAIAADFLRTELALSPETATRLGLERHLGPSASFALDNHSQSGFERRRLVRIELLQRLQTRPRLAEEHALTRDLYVAERALVDLISLEQIGFGRFDYATLHPYAVDPYSGIWIEGPTLLAFRQSITNKDQASAYLARLRALSASIQDTKRRMIADQASGIILPTALAVETRNRIRRLVGDDVNGLNRLNETFRALVASVNDLDEAERTQLTHLVRLEISEKLRPAYQDLISALTEASDGNSAQLGIWAQPYGHDLFSGILTALLGESVDLERLHQSQLDAVTRQRARVNELLVLPEGMNGPIEAKPNRLSAQFSWFASAIGIPNSIAAPTASTDTLMTLAPKSDWARIAADTSFAAQVEALSAFELKLDTSPYLNWQSESPGFRAPYRQIVEYPAIISAWQNYVWAQANRSSETPQLTMMGIAEQSISLIQTVLASADTGIHLQRWDLATATDHIATQSGLSEPLSRQLALSIAARPGHHSAVAIAWQRVEGLSERAKAVLGEQYSEIEFQRTLIEPGPRPLSLIERDIEAWYGARLADQSN